MADVESIEDKEELIEIFMDIDTQIYEAKWNLAKLWMFGTWDLTDEQQLAAAGLV